MNVAAMNLTYVNQGDAASALTASSAATGYPASNVQFPFKTKTWRSSTITDEWLKFDLGSAQNITMVALVNTNLVSADTVYFCGHASDLGSGSANWHGHATVDQTITVPAGGMIIKYFTGASLRWWFLGATKVSGSYIEIGRVYFGAQYTPPRNYDQSWTHELADPSITVKSIGGQVHTDIHPQYNRLAITFSYLTRAQKNTLLGILQTIGLFSEVILSLDPVNDPNLLSFYGRFTGTFAFAGQLELGTGQGYYNITINFEESI